MAHRFRRRTAICFAEDGVSSHIELASGGYHGRQGDGIRGIDGCFAQQLIDLLNQDLSREYQAIIAYVVYSQVLKGAST